jgi:hypothetical protein
LTNLRGKQFSLLGIANKLTVNSNSFVTNILEYKLTEEAKQMLNQIKEPIGVISIAG